MTENTIVYCAPFGRSYHGREFNELYYRQLTERCFRNIGSCALAIAETYRFPNENTINFPHHDLTSLIEIITQYRDGLQKIQTADHRLFNLAKSFVEKTYPKDADLED